MSVFSSPEWTNARLVEECLRGNQQAWHLLLDRYKGLVYSIPFKYGAPPQDAADIFQSVWLELFHELPRLRDADALQGWLIRVTSHKCYHWKRQRISGAGELDERELNQVTDSEPVPAELLAAVEREQLVREAMAELPPRCRQMIELLFFEHPPLPYNVVAEKLKLARGSIGFIRGRCLKRLKKILEEKGL
jgi:RNA polymerase sigma factor (sigma-70 family)